MPICNISDEERCVSTASCCIVAPHKFEDPLNSRSVLRALLAKKIVISCQFFFYNLKLIIKTIDKYHQQEKINFTSIINTKYLPEIYVFGKSVLQEMSNKQNSMFIFSVSQSACCSAILNSRHSRSVKCFVVKRPLE